MGLRVGMPLNTTSWYLGSLVLGPESLALLLCLHDYLSPGSPSVFHPSYKLPPLLRPHNSCWSHCTDSLSGPPFHTPSCPQPPAFSSLSTLLITALPLPAGQTPSVSLYYLLKCFSYSWTEFWTDSVSAPCLLFSHPSRTHSVEHSPLSTPHPLRQILLTSFLH